MDRERRMARDMQKQIRVGIVGASGYIGGEALRLLLGHPFVEVVAATSPSNAGQEVTRVHPHLAKLTELRFTEDVTPEEASEMDALFMALPHGGAIGRVPAILGAGGKGGPKGEGPVVFDLSGDFRLKDADTYAEYYGLEQTAPGWAQRAAYGLTEWNREAIREARLVACPGCFPTGALLALTPLARAGMLTGRVIVDAATGSSGSGNKPGEGTHHPMRAGDFRAYGVFKHRHAPEIAQELGKWGRDGDDEGVRVTFTPHSAPMVRGIFTTAYAFLEQAVTQAELTKVYEEAYGKERFVRLVESPRVGVVTHSNFCDLNAATDGEGTVIVTTAIDNLVKGGAGQGVQNMNVVFGWAEQTGLMFPGTMP
jgi:N-acetyl-gamma-glutamyl-phosphate reductase